jgi:hypothetical protein
VTIDRRITIGAIAFAAVLVAGIVAIALWVVPDRREDIWVDLARAGIQLVVIIGLGGVVSSVLRGAEASRDRRRQRDERRFAIFEQLVTAYHRLKFVRRNLRMVGIRSQPDVLRAEQIEALRTGMQTITEVQLTLEEVLRSLDARSVFDNATAIRDHLGDLGQYVGRLVDEWERHGKCFWVDHQTRKVSELRALQRFLGPAKDDFRPHAAEPLGWVEWIVRGELPEGVEAARRSTRARSEAHQQPQPERAPDPFATDRPSPISGVPPG